jgi:hypothetical protein
MQTVVPNEAMIKPEREQGVDHTGERKINP